MINKLLPITLALISANLALANELPLARGQWEVVTRPDFKGIPANPLPKTEHLCLDEESIRNGAISLRTAHTCKITGGQWVDNKVTLRVFCPDAPPNADIPAELTASDIKSFTAYVTLNQMITYHYTGQWMSSVCQ